MTSPIDEHPHGSPLDVLGTGHAVTDALIAPAKALLAALHADDGPAMTRAFETAADVITDSMDGYPDPGDAFLGAVGLAMVLAAAVDPDHDFLDCVSWTRDKAAYRVARVAGLSHYEAVGCTLIRLEAAHAAQAGSAEHSIDDDPAPPQPERRLHLVRNTRHTTS